MIKKLMQNVLVVFRVFGFFVSTKRLQDQDELTTAEENWLSQLQPAQQSWLSNSELVKDKLNNNNSIYLNLVKVQGTHYETSSAKELTPLPALSSSLMLFVTLAKLTEQVFTSVKSTLHWLKITYWEKTTEVVDSISIENKNKLKNLLQTCQNKLKSGKFEDKWLKFKLEDLSDDLTKSLQDTKLANDEAKEYLDSWKTLREEYKNKFTALPNYASMFHNKFKILPSLVEENQNDICPSKHLSR